MRILHITESLIGGVASYLQEIAGFQSETYGREAVRFLVPAGGAQHLPTISPDALIEYSPSGRSAGGLLQLAIAARREVKSFDPSIVHLHSTFAGAVVRPALVFERRRRAIIYCAHGWAFAMEVSSWQKLLYASAERGMAVLTDAIINISASEHAQALAMRLSKSKMTVIRHGIGPSPPCVSRSGEDCERIDLIFVGRHDRQKGLDILLQVIARVRNSSVHFHIVGAPVLDSSDPTSLVGLANATFYGWLPRAEVAEMVARSDALIMPSRWEGFGLTALEAMRLGKPVIASRRGALVEIIQDGETGLHFDPDEPQELWRILNSLDKQALAAMGARAREVFNRDYTAERMNRELATLYDTCFKRLVHAAGPSLRATRDLAVKQ